MLDTSERWQSRFESALGRRLVFAADEYYLMAGRPFPALAEYEEVSQHENGIGMARVFEAEVHDALAGAAMAPTGTRSGFFAWVDGAPAEGYHAPRHTGGGRGGLAVLDARDVAVTRPGAHHRADRHLRGIGARPAPARRSPSGPAPGCACSRSRTSSSAATSGSPAC